MIDGLVDGLVGFLSLAQQWLFEGAVQSLLFAIGAMRWQEDAFDATEWFVIGALEVAVLAVVLGAVPVAVFFMVTPLFDAIEGWLRLAGFSRLNLEAAWPWLAERPLAAFVVYLIVLDAVDYLIHRGQHAWRWWWALHAVHHSQRQMTFWSDDRNHLLDDLIRDALFALLAIAIGVAPAQFVALIVVSRALQSLHHANLRWRFGPVGERLLVSPSFHRRHHAIGVGHEGRRHGCNFAVLFPIWDVLGGTADFRPGFVPTGIRDQLAGRDYGRGFWSQQWRAMLRWAGKG